MTAGYSPGGIGEVLTAFASGVTLVTVADGRDDVGTTVSAFCPVSAEPPLVLVSLLADSYPAELLGRIDQFAVTLLAAGQRMLAGRFAVAGRPGARLLLDGVPHRRGELSGALIAGRRAGRDRVRGQPADPGRGSPAGHRRDHRCPVRRGRRAAADQVPPRLPGGQPLR